MTTSINDRNLKPHVPEDDVRFRRNVFLREDPNFELPAFLQVTDEVAAVETEEQHS